MQNATLWRALLGVEKTVIESVEYDDGGQVLLAALIALAMLSLGGH